MNSCLKRMEIVRRSKLRRRCMYTIDSLSWLFIQSYIIAFILLLLSFALAHTVLDSLFEL